MNFKNLIYMTFLFAAGLISAQQTIQGSVSDETGPLPGVSVLEKGTSNGVVSDFDGNFTITVSGSDATLVFSYIGFQTQEVSASSESFDIILSEGTNELDEIVVTGYGTQKKATLTGSIATIGGGELEKSSSPNLGTALAGKVAGFS